MLDAGHGDLRLHRRRLRRRHDGAPALFLALRTFAQPAQVLEREQPGVVAIAPDDLVGVVAHGSDAYRRVRQQLPRLEHPEGIGGLVALISAAGARALLAQVAPGVEARVPVAPVDDEAIAAFFAQRDGTQGRRL